MTTTFDPGLESTIAAETRLSDVRGYDGELIIAGFAAEEIAPRATFEEVLFLLWHDRLPTRTELNELSISLASDRHIPDATLELLRDAAGRSVPPMDALRMGIASLALSNDFEEASVALVSQTATLVAAYSRLSQGLEPILPPSEPGHVASFLAMIEGESPSPERVRALETYLNTVVDHGLNASTFAARVIIATHTDLVSAITGAVGALKGPLHGGAPGPALDMVFEIGSVERAEPYLRAVLERGERLMGFGHRVYKVRDPRADILAHATQQLDRSGAGDEDLYQLAAGVEEVALRLLEEYKPGRNLQTNVEYYTALLLHCLGFPTSLFTSTFAVGRVAGWIAHAREQLENGRLIRPASTYTGTTDREWVPVENR
jgi:citrate synthase